MLRMHFRNKKCWIEFEKGILKNELSFKTLQKSTFLSKAFFENCFQKSNFQYSINFIDTPLAYWMYAQ